MNSKIQTDLKFTLKLDDGLFIFEFYDSSSDTNKTMYIDTLKICHDEITNFNVFEIGSDPIVGNIWMVIRYNTVKESGKDSDGYSKTCFICVVVKDCTYHVFKENWED